MKNKRFFSLLRFGLWAALSRRRAFAVAIAFAALMSAAATPWRTAQAQTRPQIFSAASIVGDSLVIEGTPGDDRIVIRAARRPDTVRVVFNGIDVGRYGPVTEIVVNAGDGDDTVLVGPKVELPARLNGGPGNDRLRGGSGPDLVFGEEGDDLLIGTRGRDALDTGPGSNRLVVRRPMGKIHVGPSAAGDALRILPAAYTLRPLKGHRHASASELGPIIVGGADLQDETSSTR